jgi:hypothetical protein
MLRIGWFASLTWLCVSQASSNAPARAAAAGDQPIWLAQIGTTVPSVPAPQLSIPGSTSTATPPTLPSTATPPTYPSTATPPSFPSTATTPDLPSTVTPPLTPTTPTPMPVTPNPTPNFAPSGGVNMGGTGTITPPAATGGTGFGASGVNGVGSPNAPVGTPPVAPPGGIGGAPLPGGGGGGVATPPLTVPR